MANEPASYPVSLLLEGRRCLIVGSGTVALRKAKDLLGAGAKVTVIAPDAGDTGDNIPLDPLGPLAQLEELGSLGLELYRRQYRLGEAASFDLVLATTGTSLDAEVASDANAVGTLVNCADDAGNSRFIAPAVGRRGPVSVAVGTDGASPALASYLRDRLVASLPPDVEHLAEQLSSLRVAVKAAGIPTEGLPWRELIVGLLERGPSSAAAEMLASDFLASALAQAKGRSGVRPFAE